MPHHAARTIHGRFECQVRRSPNRAAASFAGATVTYTELNARANRLAHRLLRLGVRPEDRVAILLPRSTDWLVAVLGILKSGGAYVPLDPAWPTPRLEAVCRNAGVQAVVTTVDAPDLWPAALHSYLIDVAAPAAGRRDDRNPLVPVNGSCLAYVIYTSGSTGTPKGVMVEHRSVLNLLHALRSAIYARQPPRPLRVAVNGHLAFDTSVKQIVQVCEGHTLVILPEQARIDADALSQLLGSTPVDVLDCTPTQLASWIAEGIFTRGTRTPGTVLIGGEAIGPGLWRRLLEIGGTAFFNVYGPTECTVDAVTCRVTSPRESPRLGKALPRIPVHVLDEQMSPAAIGEPGELYIGGLSVSRGYLGAPALTAERFVPDPFSRTAGSRLYRTGDRARWLPDGEVEFLGRADNQVKVNGFRIELAEIESVLERHPAVRQAMVAARENARGVVRLVAYLVPHDASSTVRPSTKAIREMVQEHLPRYMTPGAVVWLQALPVMPSGKVDRAALPDPPDAPEYVGPSTRLERVLCDIWASVLGRPDLGIHDAFLDVGGHSLLAVQIAARIREALRREIRLEQIFEHDTVATLARALEREDASDDVRFPPLRPRVPGPLPPVSCAQERIWFLQRLAPSSVAYVFRTMIRISGPLNVTALQRSLTEIVRRHEILRTTFPEIDGRPRQMIHAPWLVPLPVVKLTGSRTERDAQLAGMCRDEFATPFDVTELPLARWKLVALSNDEHALLQTEHHLVHDGWSFHVLLSELRSLYSAFSRGASSPLVEPRVQFADFCVWQREWLDSAHARAQLAYWRTRLAGSPPVLNLALDSPRPAVQTFHGALERIELPPELANALRATSRREQVTLFMTMLAGFLALLERYSGERDLCVGTGVANRRRREAEALIGMIINTVVLRVQLDGNPTIRELLHRVRAASLEAYDNQDIPFDAVVDAVHPRRDLSVNPLFQVAFSFHDAPLSGLDLGDACMTLDDLLDNGSAKFDLNIIVIPRAEQQTADRASTKHEGLSVIWEYNTDLFGASTIRRMTAYYEEVLRAIAKSCDDRLSSLPALTGADEQQLASWNSTHTPYPQHCVQELFRQCASRHPGRTAVLDRKEQLTYAELDHRSNLLAAELMGRGARRGSVIAVFVERGTALATAVLAILKTGAAYLPLDPDYPPGRIAFIVDDASVFLIVTDSSTRVRLGCDAPSIDVDCWRASPGSAPPAHPPGLNDAAYVIYTSGSTGVPKGVLVSHRSLTNVVTAVARELGPGRVDRVFAISNFTFDIAALELFLPLTTGGSCWIASPLLAGYGNVRAELSESGATLVQATPSVWRMLLDQGWTPDSRVVALTGGEPLPPTLVEELSPMRAVWNMYGPTETTIWSTCHRVASAGATTVPIGRPLANTSVYVLDDTLRHVPIGVFGELCIGGIGLALGYLNRPGMTAAAFVPDPFSKEPGSRMYRTGDIARFRPDGTLEFAGRRDNQVKLRGYRIELGEIESVLLEHELVREAVAVVREEPPRGSRLVAYVVTDSARADGLVVLRRHLVTRLPGYMVPADIVPIAQLPKTSNGKVDRTALPDVGEVTGDGFVAPQTRAELALAAIWAELLNRPAVGTRDHFFDVGGHSLTALQLISLVRQQLGVELPVRAVFDHPVLADMAAIVEESLAARATATVSV